MREEKAFSILEIIVSISLFVVAILLVNSAFISSQRSYTKGVDGNELSQNARVTLDRISREIRQSTNIVTSLPDSCCDLSDPASEEIFFQDGHDISQITYIRYYLDGSNLKRQNKAYYFSADPGTYVAWNSLDEFGGSPDEIILEDDIVGEFFNYLGFWRTNNLTHLSIKLSKGTNNFSVDSAVFLRN